MYADDTHLTYAGDDGGSIESSLSDAGPIECAYLLECKQTYSKYD